MGFFSRKDDDSPALTKDESKLQAAVERSWVENISDADAVKLFDDLDKVFDKTRKMSTNPLNRRIHNVGVASFLKDIRQEWLKIDRKKLSDKDAHIVYETLVVTLPSIAGDYRKYASEYSISVATHGYYIFDGTMVLSNTQTANWRLSKCLGRIVEIQHKQWNVDYVASVTQNTLSVPDVRWRDRDLRIAVEGLHDLWAKADARTLNELDRFYVDEVASRYFPDAWRMFKSFEASNEELYAEARTIFLEQVGLMGRRLKSMVTAEVREASLQELKAHSTFLREVSATR